MEPIRSSFVSVHGTDIFYAEAGAGRPVVLLHGLSDTHRTWRKLLPALAKTHRVLMPDLPGCGMSGRPNESYALELRLASLPRILEDFGQPFMSTGTSLALRFVGAVVDPEDARWMREVNSTPGTARAFGRTVRDVINWRGQRRHFLDRVSEVAELPPIALFWGERDRIIPVKHALESTKLLANVPVTRFPSCGHFPQHQVPDELSRALLAFLDASSVLPARLRAPAAKHSNPVFTLLARARRDRTAAA